MALAMSCEPQDQAISVSWSGTESDGCLVRVICYYKTDRVDDVCVRERERERERERVRERERMNER